MANAKNTNTNKVTAPTAAQIELSYGNVKLTKGVVNAPKANPVTKAIHGLQAIVKKFAVMIDNHTAFGHKANCKGGVIDEAILTGNCQSIENIIDYVINSGLAIVERDRQKFKPQYFRAVIAKRIYDHVKWCATAASQHGGWPSRLAKTGLAGYHAELVELMQALLVQFEMVYKVHYAGLYKNRNKKGLLAVA